MSKKKNLKKKYSKEKEIFKRIQEAIRKKEAKKRNLIEIFLKRNPFVLIRKNYKILFKKFFKNRTITPLLFNFLQLAYFKLNINKIYRPRLITKPDSYATKLYKFNLSNFKQFKLSPFQYFFVLMKKKTHFQKILDFYQRDSKYNRQLHQLYYFQKVKKTDFTKFTLCPEFLHINTEDYPFNKHDALRPLEHIYIRKIINFFYPVTEIHFKESNIHGKPMKTKLPRRI